MKFKIGFLILILILLPAFIFLLTKSENNSTKAQTQNYSFLNEDNIIRVGISTNDFSQLEYNNVSITSSGKFYIKDKSSDSIIAASNGNEIFTVKVKDGKLIIFKDNTQINEQIEGPLGVKSSQGHPIQIVRLKRAGKPAYYRSEIEIIKAPGKADKFSVVNILSLEDYLKGVVPNEIPVSFGVEAVKAQTIAARNYAIRPRVKPYPQFDICDSVQCQVYFGYNTENPISNRAIEDTKGLFALYSGEVIMALYSSTAGGYTESYANAFSDPAGENFPAKSIPYLTGKPDIEGIPSLDNEKAAREFYTSRPESYDCLSSYYRWNKVWSRTELESMLNRNLSKYSGTTLITPKFEKGTDIGNLERIDVTARGISGKAMEVLIQTSKGKWTIKKELLIRRILENNGKILPSANVIFNNKVDSNGILAEVEAIGGGLGHGVGMSQYGAGYMSKKGFTFDNILQHYYSGIAIGTLPVFITPGSMTEPIEQEFNSPNGNAYLLVDNSEGFNSLKVNINSKDITFDKSDLKNGLVRIKLNKHIERGNNKITYYPPDAEQEGKMLKTWIEIYQNKD